MKMETLGLFCTETDLHFGYMVSSLMYAPLTLGCSFLYLNTGDGNTHQFFMVQIWQCDHNHGHIFRAEVKGKNLLPLGAFFGNSIKWLQTEKNAF